MEKRYWDSLAEDYEEQVLNVYANDKHGVVRSFVSEYFDKQSDAADFGCGIGWGIPLLAERAQTVFAVDISAKLLKRAETRCRRYKNVRYIECDLRQAPPPIPHVKCILSVNVLISPRDVIRKKILYSIRRSLKPRGVIILVVPSLESQLWTYNRLFDKIKAKSGNPASARRTVNSKINRQFKSISEGIFRISDTDTKCFLSPELEYFLETNGFNVLAKSKVPYSWGEELMRIQNRNASRPWHWLAVAQKVSQ